MKQFVRSILLGGALFWATCSHAQSVYENRYLDNDRKSVLETLNAQTPTSETRSYDELMRAGTATKDDPFLESLFYGRAISKKPASYEGWFLYSESLQRMAAYKNVNPYQVKRTAKTAGYAAYQYAKTTEEKYAALWNLGQLFETDKEWSSALDIYRSALSLRENRPGRTHYDKLREQYGFSVQSYDVGTEDGNPKICFQFSEALSTNNQINWAQYLRIEGLSNYSVQRNGTQLCAMGLEYGRDYTISIRQGTPNRNNETLFKDYRYEIRTHDREALVRFTGTNYVLPSTGQEGIPVVTINVSSLDIDILRVGDRNLVNTLSQNDGEFLNQISSYVEARLKERLAVKIWSGTLATENKPNLEVTTAFPISEAIKKFEPGVYVMSAKPSSQKQEEESGDDEEDQYYDRYDELATQWFIVSDLGITAFTGNDGVHVAVNSLATAKPVQDARVSLVTRNNEVLATLKTDENGLMTFDPGLSRGTGGMQPSMVVVATESDYAFLNLGNSAFDLTDRGVKGPPPLETQGAFLYTERGVYRPGEVVNLTALMRDHAGVAIQNTPMIIKVYRPDGVEFRSFVTEDDGMGGRALAIPLLSGASRGTWRINAFTDPKLPAIGSLTFAVEDYVPERLKIEVTPESETVALGQKAELAVQVDYLFGAPGTELPISGRITTSLASEYPGYEGYQFGLHDEEVSSSVDSIDSDVRTDEKGHATVAVPIPDISTTRPVKATISLEASEDGGRAVSQSVTLPVLPKRPTIGVKPLFSDLASNENASFNIVLLDSELARLGTKQLNWTLYEVHYDYQWYRSDGRWVHESKKRLEKVKQGTLALEQDNPASLSIPVDVGYKYQLTLETDVAGEVSRTTMEFRKGWFGEGKSNIPDRLELALDKNAYDTGDVMKVRITPRVASEVLLAVVSDKIYPLKSEWVSEQGTLVEVPVTGDWGAGAYLVALSHRPLDQKAKRQPDRSIGLAWFTIAKAERTLKVEIKAEALVRPSNTASLPVKISGMAPGEEAYVTIALVDNGILSLTKYKTPDPIEHYFGQRSMGAEIRDLYGFLIDGMQGMKGAIRSGGDGMDRPAPQPGLAQEPLVRYSGIVKTDQDGSAVIQFEMSEFNGSGRIMAVAWTESRVGSAEKELTVRDKVVMAGTLPRFLMIGDETQFTAVVHNVEGTAGDYTLELAPRGPVLFNAAQLQQKTTLTKAGKTVFTIPFKAGGVGEAFIEAILTGPDDFKSKQTLRLAVLPGSQSRLELKEVTLNAGETFNLTPELTKDVIYGTGAVAVTMAPVSGFDVPALLSELDRYPYGCTEQTTSRALPLLYANELSAAQSLGVDDKLDGRVQQAVTRILSRQSSSGSFGMWSAGTDYDIWLNAYVADFLTRASERGLDVPRLAIDKVLERLRNDVANISNANNDEGVAYGAYVLARNGRPVIGDLRYIAENQADRMKSPLALAHIAAGLALLGDEGRAKTVFQKALAQLKEKENESSDWRSYGSRLRDIAAMLALSYEAPALKGLSADLVSAFKTERQDRIKKGRFYTSTQEKTWMVMAARSIMESAKSMATRVNGKDVTGIVFRSFSDETLAKGPVSLENKGSSELALSLGVSGNPITPQPAVSNGISISRQYYTIEGEELESKTLQQNDRIVVIVTVRLPQPGGYRLVLSDFLPAGLELENPKLGDADDTLFPWIKDVNAFNHVEHRDDRFTVAFDETQGTEQKNSKERVFRYGYSARAVSPGMYRVPAAEVEAMYTPYIFGRTGYDSLEVQTSAQE